MSEMMFLHRAVTRRLELVNIALEASVELGDEERITTNKAKANELREVLAYMEKLNPTCSNWTD